MYTNSSLASYTRISPNRNSPRNHSIDTISIHCYVGQVSVEDMGAWFANIGAQASSNYGIGSDGRIGLFVSECDRSWCTSSRDNDNRAITIECASDRTDPYAVNDQVYESLIKLLVDICKRNHIKQLLWKGDKSLIGQVDKQNMTVHRWFANKSCPGDWMYQRMGDLAATVTARLGSITSNTGTTQPVAKHVVYKVQIGAYTYKKNAEEMLARVKKAGFNAFVTPKQDKFYRVQVGAYTQMQNAEDMYNRIRNAGFNAIIKEYEAN